MAAMILIPTKMIGINIIVAISFDLLTFSTLAFLHPFFTVSCFGIDTK